MLVVMLMSISQKIEMTPVGFVRRSSSDEYEKDRSLVSRIVFKNGFVKGLDGIEGWSHVYVIFWMDKIKDKEKTLVHPGGNKKVGAFRH